LVGSCAGRFVYLGAPVGVKHRSRRRGCGRQGGKFFGTAHPITLAVDADLPRYCNKAAAIRLPFIR
jgi:hypothetical protein